MKKSRTLKMFSARATMLMFAAMFSAGAWAQSSTHTFELIGPNAKGEFKAVIHGDRESDCGIGQDAAVTLYEIECQREFQVNVPATIVLPFPTTGLNVTGGNFYEFACVEWDSSASQWVASMTSVAANNLQRNTPYIVVPTATNLTFGISETKPSAYTDVATVTCDCWAFVGTYKKTIWADKSVDISDIVEKDYEMHQVAVGDYYGFAAKSGTEVGGSRTVSAGEFVKCSGDGTAANSAYILPMRAYLQFVGDENCPANNDTKMLTRQSGNNLPTSIAVVLRDANGEVTNVGAVSKETGEITFEGWFTTDGIKLPAEPTKSGVYIHNGKKVVVK